MPILQRNFFFNLQEFSKGSRLLCCQSLSIYSLLHGLALLNLISFKSRDFFFFTYWIYFTLLVSNIYRCHFTYRLYSIAIMFISNTAQHLHLQWKLYLSSPKEWRAYLNKAPSILTIFLVWFLLLLLHFSNIFLFLLRYNF